MIIMLFGIYDHYIYMIVIVAIFHVSSIANSRIKNYWPP